MSQFKVLFTPTSIGSMKLRNRLAMAPVTTQWAGPGDTISQRMIDYFAARARGGVGLITLEVCSIDRRFPYHASTPGLWGDENIESHARLTRAVHEHGARIVPQVAHPGPDSASLSVNKLQAIGPSSYKSVATLETCREITLEEMQLALEQFGEAARRAREAGYDGIELHCAHGHMLCGSFMCALRNKRTDAYSGGTIEGRLKFPLEVIRKVKERAGKDFPLTLRVSGDERTPGGRTLQETLQIVPRLIEAGVDALHISGGMNDPLATAIIPGSYLGEAINVRDAAAIKKAAGVPVMVVANIHDPERAEEILRAGQADIIAMGRPLLADPELPNKAARGDVKRIRRCISCANCVDSMAEDHNNMHCAVNAFAGKEATLSLEKAARAKKVMVIGAGPAGMEAARVAAIRGHSVTLYDRLGRLGGTLLFADTVHPDNDRLLNYLTAEIKSLPVCVKLGSEVTPDLVASEKPDAVILALGPNLTVGSIPGSDGRRVFSGPDMKRMLGGKTNGAAAKLPPWQRWALTLGSPLFRFLDAPKIRWATRYWMPVGKRVVIIGGDLAACELAAFLGERNRMVTLLEASKVVAPDVMHKRRFEVRHALQEAGVAALTSTRCEEITPAGVVYTTKDGERKTAECDTVVIAGEVMPNLDLQKALEGKVPELYVVGDCKGLGLIRRAIHEGAGAACKI